MSTVWSLNMVPDGLERYQLQLGYDYAKPDIPSRTPVWPHVNLCFREMIGLSLLVDEGSGLGCGPLLGGSRGLISRV